MEEIKNLCKELEVKIENICVDGNILNIQDCKLVLFDLQKAISDHEAKPTEADKRLDWIDENWCVINNAKDVCGKIRLEFYKQGNDMNTNLLAGNIRDLIKQAMEPDNAK
jgi:hypothetical protein